jgi:potassium efflux system protein
MGRSSQLCFSGDWRAQASSVVILFAIFLGAVASSAQSQPETYPPVATVEDDADIAVGPGTEVEVPLTVESVEALRAALIAAEGEPGETEAESISLYDQAIKHLQREKQSQEQAASFAREREAAAAELVQVRDELAQPLDTQLTASPDASLEQLRQFRDQAEASLRSGQERVQELEAERENRVSRRKDIPDRREELIERREEIETELATPPAAETPLALANAREVELRARLQALDAELAALSAELANYEARTELLPLRIERANRRVVAREKIVQQWRDIVSEREKLIARQEAEAARKAVEEAASASPAVKAIAERVLELADRRVGPEGVLTKKSAAQETLDQIRRSLDDVRQRYQFAVERSRAAGLSGVVDERLRRERADLPEPRELEAKLGERRAELSTVQFRIAELEGELRALPPVVVQKEDILRALPPSTPERIREQIDDLLEEQLTDLRSKYRLLIADLREYEDLLLSAQEAQGRLLQWTQAFHDFISERILWVRSSTSLGKSTLIGAWDDARTFLSPGNWRDVGLALWVDARANPVIWVLWVLVIGGLLMWRPRASDQLQTIAQQVRRVYTDSIGRTIQALAITLLAAAIGPLIMWFIASRLSSPTDIPAFGRTIGHGLSRLAILYLTIDLVRQFCRADGLADVHFDWRKSSRLVLRRNLLWFEPLILPLAFITTCSDSAGGGLGSDDLGQPGFIAAMIVVAILFARILRPKGGLFEGVLAANRDGWLDKLRYVWFPAAVAAPLALAVVTGLGYFYTAIQLERGMIATIWLIFLLTLLHGVVLRWLMHTRRKLAIEEARKRRAAMQAQAATEAEAEGASPPPPTGEPAVALEEPKLDINAIDTQARQMLRSALWFGALLGLWAIWSQMLPALNMLDRVELWPELRYVSEERVDVPEGLTTAPAETETNGALTTEPTPGDPASADETPANGGEASDAGTAITMPGMPASPTMQTSPTDAAAGATEDGVLTLADVIWGIIIITITILVGKNLPGILEITLLQRLPMEPSGRYAVTTIARYVIIIVGVMIAFTTIGFTWSKLQWLVAAITFGLAFGLQEIFANFVSGIIILFERPVRVGDTVTIGEVSGTVTRVRMRATTITDWDRKELIIPNKEFVTGQIINWSLSDQLLRVIVPVGIAYGSDTELARRILLEVAADNATVLDDPPPRALFLGFGDNSLGFDLRVFIPSIDYFLKTKDELHFEIDRRFREAGVEIAFPQRDIHIRSIKSGLPVSLSDARDEAMSS